MEIESGVSGCEVPCHLNRPIPQIQECQNGGIRSTGEDEGDSLILEPAFWAEGAIRQTH